MIFPNPDKPLGAGSGYYDTSSERFHEIEVSYEIDKKKDVANMFATEKTPQIVRYQVSGAFQDDGVLENPERKPLIDFVLQRVLPFGFENYLGDQIENGMKLTVKINDWQLEKALERKTVRVTEDIMREKAITNARVKIYDSKTNNSCFVIKFVDECPEMDAVISRLIRRFGTKKIRRQTNGLVVLHWINAAHIQEVADKIGDVHSTSQWVKTSK